ncbi:MAG TPA: hypothetical protein VJ943_08790 [Desulfotignum sp.]|nr:hypothetical protein [Desulfotignum sp.]
MVTPTAAFVQWFDNIPLELRKYLAHVFRVCTTEDTSQMAARSDQSLTGFRAWAVKKDFPLRMAAKMFYIRAVFDMVILHHKEITDDDGSFGLLSQETNIVRLSAKQWETVINSWVTLRQATLSDAYVHSWTSWMIKQQKESQ